MKLKTTLKTKYKFSYKPSTLRILNAISFILFLTVFNNTYAQTTWTGATSSDWFDASNWSDGIPDANDDVSIPDAGISPIINTTGALAQSVSVIQGATLTITATGDLTINLLANNGTNNSRAMFVFGFVNNSGTINIEASTTGPNYGLVLGEGSLGGPGLFNNLSGSELNINNVIANSIELREDVANEFNNEGTVTIVCNSTGSSFGVNAQIGVVSNENNASINIDNATSYGVLNSQNSTFNNDGELNIGSNSTNNVNTGVENGGTFNNLENGILSVNNSSGNVVLNFYTGIFDNDGIIDIGLESSGEGFISLRNDGDFNNNVSAEINIASFSYTGLTNEGGTTGQNIGDFNNNGTITIDGEDSGNYGLVTKGGSDIFNNNETGVINVTSTNVIAVSSGFSTPNDSGCVFNNNGTITANGSWVSAWDGTFNNLGGSIEVSNSSTGIQLYSGTSTFNNSAEIIINDLLISSNIVNGQENSFTHNAGGTITGIGQINIGTFTNNGGGYNPGDINNNYGLIRFRDNADLSNSIINLDINGNTTPGTDYDKIEIFSAGEEILTLGGTLNLNITYTPIEDVEYITIFEAPVINGEFTIVNGLPSNEWNILYNFPETGQVSIEYGAINSVQSGPFSDPNTWADGLVPNADTPAIVEDNHTVTIDVPSIQVARLEVTDNATVIIPSTTTLTVSESEGPAIINDGTIQIDGNIDITFPTQAGIVNSGSIALDGEISIGFTETAIVNTDTFVVNEDGILDIDFTTEAAIESQGGSEFTNNGLTLIGLDPTGGNSVGLYGIDLRGYFENTLTGILEIKGSTDAAIFLPDGVTTLTGRNANDGIFLNNGILRLDALQTQAVQQSDDALQMKGKYTHVLKKRPQPNPGRDVSDFASYLNELFSFLTGSGIIESDLTTLNGGTISPGILDGEEGIIIFDGDEDFQNVTIDLDVNGKTLKGTDYDLVAVIGTATLGGDLTVDFNYTPTEGDLITIIEADNLIGTFNNPTLPMDWTIQYNNPSQGKVSLQFGDALSIDENTLDELNIYNLYDTKEIVIEGLLIDETKLDLMDISGRIILNQTLEESSSINIVDVSFLAPGTYIVKLNSLNDITRTKKVIIN